MKNLLTFIVLFTFYSLDVFSAAEEVRPPSGHVILSLDPTAKDYLSSHHPGKRLALDFTMHTLPIGGKAVTEDGFAYETALPEGSNADLGAHASLPKLATQMALGIFSPNVGIVGGLEEDRIECSLVNDKLFFPPFFYENASLVLGLSYMEENWTLHATIYGDPRSSTAFGKLAAPRKIAFPSSPEPPEVMKEMLKIAMQKKIRGEEKKKNLKIRLEQAKRRGAKRGRRG